MHRNRSLPTDTLGLMLVFLLPAVAATAAANGALTVTVARPDLRPLPGVTLRLAGAVPRQGVTDEDGKLVFAEVPAAAPISLTPSRSGFLFQPPRIDLADIGNAAEVTFTTVPAATDVALTMAVDTQTPLVGGIVNAVLTVQNLGTEAATDILIGFNSLPGLELESCDATQGELSRRLYDTAWKLAQLDPGARAEVRMRLRGTLPDAEVLLVAILEEMDQVDLNPRSNSALLSVQPQPAQAHVSLALTIDPAAAKVGESLPVRLTVRNEGPDDATQIVVRSYLPPGAFFFDSPGFTGLLPNVVIPRLAPGARSDLGALLSVHIPGTFTLIANVTHCEETLPANAPWPEARADYEVRPGTSRITLRAVVDPQNPRVGEDVTVVYLARNEGPDTVTSLRLFTRADPALGPALTTAPPIPPLPGQVITGDVVAPGQTTSLVYRYLVTRAGNLTNYFTVESQDQTLPNAEDHPVLLVPIHTLPSEIGLSLHTDTQALTVRSGEPVTFDFQVHNDGPHPATGILVQYSSPGLSPAEADEIIHADRVERPVLAGFIDVLRPDETVRVRKHFVAGRAGAYMDVAEVTSTIQRPDLLAPVAAQAVRLQVLPSTPPDLAISVNVDQPQVNVGEYAIFTVHVENRAAQPAVYVVVHETEAAATGLAFETVRSYGPNGDDRISSGSLRIIPRIEPGAHYSMSRTMRIRQAVRIPYFAKITGVGSLTEAEIPTWQAATEVTGVAATSDIAAGIIPDRTQVKNGDLVNFAVLAFNTAGRVASHVTFNGGLSAGFQILGNDLASYGFHYETQRPRDLPSNMGSWTDWPEIRSQEGMVSYLSAYVVGVGQLTAAVQRLRSDQIDAQAGNDQGTALVTAGPASAHVSLRHTLRGTTARVGENFVFLTEIRNEGPDRVTGLRIEETTSPNLEINTTPFVNGLSGKYITMPFDPFLRLPALEPGQNFVLQRTYFVRAAGNASHRVRVAGFDQTPLAPLADNLVNITLLPAEADVGLEFITQPVEAQLGVPTLLTVRVRNHGPSTATSIRVGITVPPATLQIGVFDCGPRARIDFLAANAFRSDLLPGESATASVYVTPLKAGPLTASIQVQSLDQADPWAGNDSLTWQLPVAEAPPLPPILTLRRVRTDFFDHTPIAEVQVDQATLFRVAPLTPFVLEGSSNFRDWEPLHNFGFWLSGAGTYTDHVRPGEAARVFRLRRE